MRYRVMNLTRNTLLADQASRADTFMERFKGLMGVEDLALGHGLRPEQEWPPRCSSHPRPEEARPGDRRQRGEHPWHKPPRIHRQLPSSRKAAHTLGSASSPPCRINAICAARKAAALLSLCARWV